MISSLSRSLFGTLFTLHYLLQLLEEMKLLVLLFIQIGLRQSNFHRALSRHLELCVLFILDYLDFVLLSEETQLTIETFSFYPSSIDVEVLISYSNSLQIAVDFLSKKALNISNLYIGGDLDIRDIEWDPFVFVHYVAGQALRDLANSYSLVYSILVLSIPTHHLDI